MKRSGPTPGTRLLLVAAVLVPLVGCSRFRKPAPKPDAGTSMSATAAIPEPSSTVSMLEAKDLPLGYWEATDGSKMSVGILPDGLARVGTAVPQYRNGARVFAQITHVESENADSFRVWLDITKIYAKEIGSYHRRSEDFELYEATILDQRVTSPNSNGHHIPDLGGQGAAPPPSFKLTFDKPRETLDVCTSGPTPKCRKLTKRKSPSDLSRVRQHAECKVDEDCVIATDGEQCDPCLCPSKPSVKSWPKKLDPDKEDTTWETKQEHLCGKEVPRKDTCPACPQLRAVCKQKQCILKP